MPLQLKPKHLDKMTFPLTQRSTRGGSIAKISAGKKQTQYDITVASGSAGAEEMRGMACLLPRSRKGGKLFVGEPFLYLFAKVLLLTNLFSAKAFGWPTSLLGIRSSSCCCYFSTHLTNCIASTKFETTLSPSPSSQA